MKLFQLKSFLLIIGSFLFSANVFASYCLTLSKSVTSCNPQEIQPKLTANDGFADIRMFVNPDKIKSISIYPNSNENIANKISETVWIFKRTGGKYEQIYPTGCVEKGSISETKDKVIFTIESLNDSCDEKKKMMQFMKKMNPNSNPERAEYRKINY